MKRSWRAAERGPARSCARLSRAVFVCASIFFAVASSAQVLEPPELEGPTYAAQMVVALEEEIAHFGRLARGASNTQRIIIHASLNWRIIAAELISQGEEASASGSVSVLIGLRLAHSRGEIDSLLIALHREFDRKQRLGDRDIAAEAAALDAISRFNDAAVDRAQTIRTVDVAQLDRALLEIFAPLADALTPSAGGEPVSHWPVRRVVRDGADLSPPEVAAGDHERSATTFDQIRDRLAEAELDDELRRALGEALLALEAEARGEGLSDTARNAGAAREAIGNLLAACEGMIAYRRLAQDEPPRDVRAVVNRLDEAYRTAEQALLGRIEALADDPQALSDPAFAALLADQAQHLADLKRVRAMPSWIASIGRINPEAAGPFENRMKTMSRRLLDANRREATVQTMSEFEKQLALFSPMPFEQELAAADRSAITATGGLHEELLDLIRRMRRQWAQDWGLGDGGAGGGEAAQRLHLLYRLTRTMAESAELLRLEGDADILNRWAAWDMPAGLLKRSMLDLPNRLKLATASATRRDDASLADELDRINREAPLTRLVGRFSITFGDALQPLPDGPRGVLGQVLYSPAADAWMIEYRQDLAELCRYAVEAHHAWFEQREEDARALQQFVNAKAEELVEAISDER